MNITLSHKYHFFCLLAFDRYSLQCPVSDIRKIGARYRGDQYIRHGCWPHPSRLRCKAPVGQCWRRNHIVNTEAPSVYGNPIRNYWNGILIAVITTIWKGSNKCSTRDRRQSFLPRASQKEYKSSNWMRDAQIGNLTIEFRGQDRVLWRQSCIVAKSYAGW